jgi:hypothetical protein
VFLRHGRYAVSRHRELETLPEALALPLPESIHPESTSVLERIFDPALILDPKLILERILDPESSYALESILALQ